MQIVTSSVSYVTYLTLGDTFNRGDETGQLKKKKSECHHVIPSQVSRGSKAAGGLTTPGHLAVLQGSDWKRPPLLFGSSPSRKM